jgi:transposase
MKPSYSQEFKQSVVQKVTSPGGPSITEMSKSLGVHYTSIRSWVQTYANTPSMKKSKEWTPEARLEAIIKTATMSENEFGEYLRANGLHSNQIEEWRQDIYSSQKGVGRPKVDPELAQLRDEKKKLTKNLERKDRALAEMSARIVLLKKSRLIWGDGEDEE